jgi:NADH-quinone oxidoreductase subunit F
MPLTPVLSKRFAADQPWKIDNYEALDGYKGLRKALAMTPDEIITTVKDSGLRGRGGAGFPTGMKWQFIPQAKPGAPSKPHYVVINADEGEPGTCRDLPLMMNDPHSMLEGIIIACYAVRAEWAFVYIRGEAVHAIRRVTQAVREAIDRGYLGQNILGSGFNCAITVHGGAGAYICGEETALLDSLEGKRGQPRLKPPFPATNGLYDAPTVVNNVGTLASVPYILLGGADWFKGLIAGEPSTDEHPNPSVNSPGTSIYSLSGRIKNPGQYEAPMGTTLRELIEMAGGMSRGKKVKFWTPGGSSTPLFTEAHLDTPLDFDSAVKAGSMNGTSAVMIFDEDDSVVQAVLKWTQFYEHESCGKCTPCREGNYWTAQILERIWHGHGTMEDIDNLLDISDNILGRSFCALGDGATGPILSSIKYFRPEFEALVKKNPASLVPADPDPKQEPAMSLATSGAIK